MIWLNPIALVGLAAVAAPILVHLLVQRRAARLRFPTLRFLVAARLAAARSRRLDDLPLLAVRAALVALAAAALAGPLVATAARRDAWSRRIVRAVVVDAAAPAIAPAAAPSYLSREFRGTPADALRRAVAWLEHAPPAARELRIASRLPIGALTDADIARVPSDVGIAFERSGGLPATRTVPFGRVRTSAGVVVRAVTFDAGRTSVRDSPDGDAPLPIDVAAPPESTRIVEAALDAVRSQRLSMPAPDRRVRATFGGVGVAAAPIRLAWMADAVARLTRDDDLQGAASRSTASANDGTLTRPPWIVVAVDAGGRPLVAAAAASDALAVASAAPAADVVTPILLRAVERAVAAAPDAGAAEVVPIPDVRLRAWARPAAPPAQLRLDDVERDDRRWFWVAVLCLLGAEEWMRRAPRAAASRNADGEVTRAA